MYLARRIELGESLSSVGSSTLEIDVSSLALEVQRSLDYYESHYDRPPISEIVIASGDTRARALSESLSTQTGMSVDVLEIGDLFDISEGVEPDMRWPGLVALGAALRSHSVRG